MQGARYLSFPRPHFPLFLPFSLHPRYLPKQLHLLKSDTCSSRCYLASDIRLKIKSNQLDTLVINLIHQHTTTT